MPVIQVVGIRILFIEVTRARKQVLPDKMTLYVGVIAVIEIIALQVQFVSNDIIIVHAACPCGIDPIAVRIHAHRRRIFSTHIDIYISTLTHLVHSPGEIEYIHK